MSRWRRFQEFLFPHAAERDPAFRREINRLSVRSLYIIAAVCVGTPILSFLVHIVAETIEPYPKDVRPWQPIAFFALACGLVASARWDWGRRHARLVALLSAVVSAAILIWFHFLESANLDEAALASMLGVVIVLLVAVVAIPALPWQIFVLGVAIGWLHWLSAELAVSWRLIPPISIHYFAGMDVVVLLCTGMAAVGYQRIFEAHRAHQSEMDAQSRLLVSENAASMGRFAATLSHELNTPIGALASAVDSIQTLELRKQNAGPEERERLKRLEADLFETAAMSAGHLSGVLARMRRFTNLDRAEVMQVNLEDLLRDVASMLEPETRGAVEVDLRCEPLPRVTVRPQQISAVFANLLHKAARANGGKGRVTIHARPHNSHLEVIIRDEGPGIPPRDLASFFEPSFRVAGSRVTGANWSLFSSRQIVREHGGDVKVYSDPGRGTNVIVVLPTGTFPH